MGTLLPTKTNLAIGVVVSAGPFSLPAAVRHVFIVSYTILSDCLFCGIIGDKDATHGRVDEFVSFLRFLFVPLVGDAGHRSGIIESPGIRRWTAKDKQCCRPGNQQLSQDHGCHRLVSLNAMPP